MDCGCQTIPGLMAVLTKVEKGVKVFYRLQLHIKPGTKISRITGLRPESVDVQISAPPRDGEANEEVVRFLCECLRLRQRNIELIAGHKSREKTVLLHLDEGDGRTCEDLLRTLQNQV